MTIGKLLATTRINFYDSDDVSKRKLLAFGSHTKAVNKAWENAGGVSDYYVAKHYTAADTRYHNNRNS